MSYLYLTPGMYLSTSKIKRFKSLDDLWIYLPDDDIELNPISKQLVIDFHNTLVKKDLNKYIKKLRPFTTDEYEMNAFLKDIGLSEAYINSEYQTTYTKYVKYYSRIEKAYKIVEKSIAGIPINTSEKDEYSVTKVFDHYGVSDKNGNIIGHCDTYREALELIQEFEDE